MSPYLALEVRLVGMSTVLGFILMASYDCLRLFRFFVPHGRLWTGLEDFFYWIYAAVMTFLLLFYENSGIVRAYIIGKSERSGESWEKTGTDEIKEDRKTVWVTGWR